MERKNKKNYIAPLVEESFCEVWSRICTQSVVTEVEFNTVEIKEQENGGTIDMSSKELFNHTWEDAE